MTPAPRSPAVRAQVPVPDREQLISALIPAGPTTPRCAPAPLPVLPASHAPQPCGAASPLPLDIARVDRSGRISARGLLRALRWGPGHRVTVEVASGVLLVTSSATGRPLVSSRGEVALPAAARSLCGITVGTPVILAACVLQDRLIVHPERVVAQVLAELHTRLFGGRDAG